MAITITEQPYGFAPRGQKLLFYATSSNVFQPQFKFGVSVYVSSTGQTLQFFISPDINGYMVFDLASVVKLSNEEATTNWHSTIFTNELSEPNGKGYEYYTVTIQEWWFVGTFTHNSATDVTTEHVVCNGVLQPSYGFKPDTNTGTIPFGYRLANATSRAMSDRFYDTHNWFYASSFAIGNVAETERTFIPALPTDYGLLTVPTSNFITGNVVDRVKYTILSDLGSYSFTKLLGTPEVTHIGVYPMNINDDDGIAATPASTPTWRYYTIQFFSGASGCSMRYVFYNAQRFGQSDCRHDNVRLAWVNSRGGWDYFNFIKKNEWTNNAERKQYRQVLYRAAPETFLATDRQLTDRETIVRRTLQIMSDWVQENEFVFLRNLFASNQVQIINEDGSQTPVSLADSSFVEKRERNGKLFNVTMNVTLSQDFWT